MPNSHPIALEVHARVRGYPLGANIRALADTSGTAAMQIEMAGSPPGIDQRTFTLTPEAVRTLVIALMHTQPSLLETAAAIANRWGVGLDRNSAIEG